MRRKVILLFVILGTCMVLLTRALYGGDLKVLEGDGVTVLFQTPLGGASKEVAEIYLGIKEEIEGIFGWKLDLRPTVLLINDSRSFRRMAESPLTVAFAVPSRNLIVIDHSKMRTHPFDLENTLKHELCHLLLHRHIKGPILPRWLDEGVCQWASGGVLDIIIDQKRSLLNRAILKGRFIPLDYLQRGFPRSKDSLLLAYEESKSFVEHIIGRSGKEGILSVLSQMKRDEGVHAAILHSLSIPLDRLEEEWHQSLREKVTWFTYLSYHLYEILFAVAALLAIGAFIKVVLKKRAYIKGAPG